ncbi:hypothetical protein WBJ53_17080 [Spirosoma sp. SC4-14]|uniref:peroxiredoxin family protein n=1 Tax=Spirosoma sp. SC4-14 TaxID=3128900 RepID=UPI0030D1716F
MIPYQRAIFTAFMVIVALQMHCLAQVGVQKVAVRQNRRTKENAPAIIDQTTGKRITMAQYNQLINENPYAYHLVPDYDEFGQPSSYTLRVSTDEERETHQFRDRDPARQPKAGQLIAPFRMAGINGKTYRSADLVGQLTILSFWISLDKPFWTEKQANDLADALQAYHSDKPPVVLGVLNSEPPKVNLDGLLPFVAIPNAYGFHSKYHITSIPTFIVIDSAGRVMATIQGANSFGRLKSVLATASQ